MTKEMKEVIMTELKLLERIIRTKAFVLLPLLMVFMGGMCLSSCSDDDEEENYEVEVKDDEAKEDSSDEDSKEDDEPDIEETPFKRLLLEDGNSAGIVVSLYASSKTAVVTDHRSSLKSNVEIPSEVTDNGIVYVVRKIGDGAFTWCMDMTSVIIPNTVTEIGNSAFWGCGLTSVKIPDSVTEIGTSAFGGCGMLRTVEIPESVTKIRKGTFSDTGLYSITIPNSVTEIEELAFWYSALRTIVIGKNVKSIGYNAFRDCNNLTYMYMKSSIPPVVDEIDSPFEIKLQNKCMLYVPKGSMSTYKNTPVWNKFFYMEEFDTTD